MVLSNMAGIGNTISVSSLPTVENSYYKVVKEISNQETESLLSTEQYIKQYFKDIPIMIEIARCESTFRQLDLDGEIHRGRVNSEDVGVMQINERYHLNQAEKKDYNIYTIEGNTAYARDLYERQGTQPWNSSRACWGKYENRNLAVNI